MCVCVRACVPVCWQLVPWWGYLIGRRLGGPSWRCVFNLVVVFLSDFIEFLMCYLSNLKFVANTWSALTRTVSFGLIPFSHQRCPNVFRQQSYVKDELLKLLEHVCTSAHGSKILVLILLYPVILSNGRCRLDILAFFRKLDKI